MFEQFGSGSPDVLYKWLFYAQFYSDLAKHHMLSEFRTDLYRVKDEFLTKAVKRATKIKLTVEYCESENAVYFETPRGQCSFHLSIYTKIDEIPGVGISGSYKWSGKTNTREIIWSFFNIKTLPPKPQKYLNHPISKEICDLEYGDIVNQITMMNENNHLKLEKLLQKELRESILLYHSTSFESLLGILKTDTLWGSHYDDGISTSRDKDYLFHSTVDGIIKRGRGECQLVLDRDKLKQRYRIKAFDYEEFKSYSDPDFNQAEDRIQSNKITNITRYIVGIHLNRNVRSNYMKLMTEFHETLKNNGIIIFGKNWEILKQF